MLQGRPGCGTCERPETRKFDFDCEAEARQDRGELVVAALTLLRAHALAGWPQIKGRAALGSFEDWDRFVPSAIVFAGGADIVELMEKTRTTDPERDGPAEMLAMLKGVGAIPGNGMKASEIIAEVSRRNGSNTSRRVGAGTSFATVRQRRNQSTENEEFAGWMALLRRLGKEGIPDPRRLGRFLTKNAGRHVAGDAACQGR